MHQSEGSDRTMFQSFEEIAMGFGSPLFELTKQLAFELESFEASGSSRSRQDSVETNSVSLHYVYTPNAGVDDATPLRRLVQTMSLLRRDDELATIELLTARHLDAAVEENSGGAIDLPFRVDSGGVVRAASRSVKVDGVQMEAISVAEHGYLAFGAVVGERLLSIAMPEKIAGVIAFEFESRA